MPTSPSSKPTLAVTLGDPCGVGPEVVLQALLHPSVHRAANILCIGSAAALERAERALGRRLRCPRIEWPSSSLPGGENLFLRFNDLEPRDLDRPAPKAKTGRASVLYLKGAFYLLRQGMAEGLVTGPISKEAWDKAGFPFRGHTEMLSEWTHVPDVVMTMVGGPLKVALVTRHLPLARVSRALSTSKVLKTILLFHQGLVRYFRTRRPRIAVCGVNPHAGEGGALGREDGRWIAPAVLRAQKLGVAASGPWPADSVFHQAYRGRYDGVVAMYHDQGLAPFKMVAMETGVNVTLGLPFPRTSPDHGTAFDIAGKGTADPRSMIEAVKLCAEMARVARKRSRSPSGWRS